MDVLQRSDNRRQGSHDHSADRRLRGGRVRAQHRERVFIPMGLFIKAGAPESFWASIGNTAADFPELTWGNFFVGNLLPVTIGNMIGDSIMAAPSTGSSIRESSEHQSLRANSGPSRQIIQRARPWPTKEHRWSPTGRTGALE
jgi:hypothetical protein